MKKFIAVLIIAFGSTFIASAQGGDYQDLLTLFVDEKYDKVVQKAVKYNEDDKTKKDALPYLFASMSYFEMSRNDKWTAKVPDAYKYCLKYIKSYAKYDPQKEFRADYEDFFADLRKSIIADGELMLDQQKYTKAKSSYSYLLNIEPNDAGAEIYLGMTFVAMKQKKDALASFERAKQLLTEKTASTETTEITNLLKNALITYSNQLAENGGKAEAKEWLELGLEMFKDDKEYKITYETIGG
ncbi:MAG: hypothetical protein R2809_12385 [Flavobacteriales bacterium]